MEMSALSTNGILELEISADYTDFVLRSEMVLGGKRNASAKKDLFISQT
jgi:hypothetical protein